MIRKAKAVWQGTGRAGNGHLSTDAGVLAVSAEPSHEGRIWRLHIPGGGAPTYKGSIAVPKR